jgi:hypothetical protein
MAVVEGRTGCRDDKAYRGSFEKDILSVNRPYSAK